MSRFIVLGLLAACSGKPAERSSTSAARATPVERAVPAAPARSPTSAQTTWPTLAAAAITTIPLAGPYTQLEEFCAERHDDCVIADSDVLEDDDEVHGWLAMAAIHSTTTGPGEMPNEVRHVGLRTASGWYVLPGLADVSGNRSGVHVDAAKVDGALVLHFNYEDGNRFENESTAGLVVCTHAPTVACTPKIVSESESIHPPRGGDDGSRDIAFRRTATYKAGKVIVAAPPPTPGGVVHTPARACADLPYGGERPVVFSK